MGRAGCHQGDDQLVAHCVITETQKMETSYAWHHFHITERKKMEETLRESQCLYHSLVEVSPLSICRKDLSGASHLPTNVFRVIPNQSCRPFGKTDFDLHPSELAEKYRHDDQAIMDSGQVRELIEERAVLGGETVVIQSIKVQFMMGLERSTV